MIPSSPPIEVPPVSDNRPPSATHECSLCKVSFTTHRQLRTHENMKHNYRCISSLLTPTNCCPNCNTIFASRTSASHHLQTSLENGFCKNHRSHNLKPLEHIQDLRCAYCLALEPEITQPFSSLSDLLRHIKSAHLQELSVGCSHSRCVASFLGKKGRWTRGWEAQHAQAQRQQSGPGAGTDCSAGSISSPDGKAHSRKLRLSQSNSLFSKNSIRRRLASLGPRRSQSNRYLVSQPKRGHTGGQRSGLPSCTDWNKDDTCVLNTEILKKPEHQTLRKRLTDWWTTKVKIAGKTENDLAEEIQVFRVEGPPTIQEASLRFDDSDNDTVDTATKKNMPFVKIVFRLRGEQETLDLTSALRLLKADIRHGSMPRSKATKELVKMLKDINKR